ncbi:NUDIX hydrolase [Mycobacterium antarcticum]|uniref:NUDIX hydrolase n=1 Tax=unclassified Mycolicibacterium TaxID=2636767 RepID=UPI0023A025CC|nr:MULTISPECIES: NUDIX domain-containing protein [unclassified Mycolicibacterium]BDX30389.1 NUDIX hydrolase [Mycolicibacterium sp. TUM20985]GLP79513.1 NUDIX hydrolase [Mycolicibacterium sp. TUM20984]
MPFPERILRNNELNKRYNEGTTRILTDYPRPSVAVDTALLVLDPTGAELLVLQVRRNDDIGWALPGTFLHPGERLADAVDRALRTKAGVRGLRPRQLHVFDDPDRDDRGWVLSVAHLAVVRSERISMRLPDRTRLMPTTQPGRLPHDHGGIVARAVDDLRTRYVTGPDPDRLLGTEFTLRQLRLAHEAVMGEALQRDRFRRIMAPQLETTGQYVAAGRGRPAELFRGRPS